MSRRRLAALVAALVVALVVASSAGTSGAQAPAQDADQRARMRTLKEEVSEASEEEAALLAALDDASERRAALDGRVAVLDPQVARAEAEASVAEAELEKVQAEFVTAQTRLALENEALAVERARLRRRAVAAYISNPPSHAAEMLLRAGNLRDIAATAGYLESIVEVQRDAVRRYTARRDATEALQGTVEVRKDAARQQRDVVVDRLADLEGLRNELADVRAEAAAEEARHAGLLEHVRRRKADFEAQIAALRTASSGVSAFLRGLAPVPGVPTLVPGQLVPPLSGFPVTSIFGPRVHPIFGTVRDHDGVDIAAPPGAPIRAAAAGTVVAAGARGGYGNATVVDHGGGLATLYAHQSEIHVAPATVVAANQVIGAVGSTGFSTGPHLHFEVRVRGVPVDPLSFLLAR